jgi:hypothetical protein
MNMCISLLAMEAFASNEEVDLINLILGDYDLGEVVSLRLLTLELNLSPLLPPCDIKRY